MGLYVLAVNSNVPPLDKPLVKQALSAAIDREAIIKSLYRGQGSLLSGAILEGDFAFDPSLPKLSLDKEKAKQLLQQAGYKDEEIILESSTNILNEGPLAEAIVQMWKEVGINARQEIIELSVRAQHYTNRDFKGIWLADPTNFLLDPDGMMWRLLGPKGLFDYWREPEFDKLGDEARFSTDEKLRKANYDRMHQIFLQHLPWIPVMQPLELYGVANTLEWKPFGNHFMDFRGYNLKVKA
jgi:ABC-type transport system substrate-binding protein